MEQYLVSARKYRPSTFNSVVGQKVLTATLKNAIATGRLAHSYLFCGGRGVGKTSCARIFAKTINCEHPTADGEACNECESCRQFNEGRSVNILELDAASHNQVDDIRELCRQVVLPPPNGHYRVFIIDEVHMLSSAAFNAFLKTLEEPPAHAIFILATTEKHKVIPTILSRCQIYDFNPISIQDMVDHLAFVADAEGIEAERSALGLIARKADGAMRDALSIFDQVTASTRGHITYDEALRNLNMLDFRYYARLVEAFLEGRVMDTWVIYKEIREHGFDSRFFLNGIGGFLRDLAVAKDPSTHSLLNVDAEMAETVISLSAKCGTDFLMRGMALVNDADLNYRNAGNKQFLVELTLAKLCQLCGPSSDSNDANGGQELRPIARPASSPAAPAAPQPAPQVAQEPEPQPYRAPSAMPTQKPMPQRPANVHPVTRAAMPRINKRPATSTADEQPGHTRATVRNEAFADQTVIEAWKAFADAHPTETILVNTMRACMPVRTNGTTFNITVENPMQVDELGRVMPELLTALRNAVANDTLTLTTDINPGPGNRATWNDNEVVAEMAAANPVFRKMIEDFKLRID